MAYSKELSAAIERVFAVCPHIGYQIRHMQSCHAEEDAIWKRFDDLKGSQNPDRIRAYNVTRRA